MRAALHGVLRALRLVFRFVAKPADSAGHAAFRFELERFAGPHRIGLPVAVPPRESFPEIRITPAPERGLLLYDGDCGFCSRSVRLLERFARKPFEKRPSREVLAALPDEVARTVSGQMLWLTPDGSIWGGSQALL